MPTPSHAAGTSISSSRKSATCTAPPTWGWIATRAISAPEVLYGEITRSAPARRSFFSESSAEARATIRISGASSRAVSAMKMLSASESTQAITARARRIPAPSSTSSSAA